jgi:ATP-binding cassette subfamily B protein
MTAPVPPPKAELIHLARLWRFLAPYRGRLVIALVALVIAAGCVLALGQGLRHVIDAGFGSSDPRLLNIALAAVVGVALLLAGATWTRFYLMMSVGERVIADLRQAVFAHVLTLSPAFFDASRTGEISSRLTNDSEQLRQVIGFGFSMFLRKLAAHAGGAGDAVRDQRKTGCFHCARGAGDADSDFADGPTRAAPVAAQSGPCSGRFGAYR